MSVSFTRGKLKTGPCARHGAATSTEADPALSLGRVDKGEFTFNHGLLVWMFSRVSLIPKGSNLH